MMLFISILIIVLHVTLCFHCKQASDKFYAKKGDNLSVFAENRTAQL